MSAKLASLVRRRSIPPGRADGPGWRCHLTALLAGFLFLLPLSADIVAGDAPQAFFAEPTTGRKVTHYAIDLPLKSDQRQTFNIPDDCAEAMRTIDSGVSFRGNIIDRRLWKKTENDCRYHDFLNRHPQRVNEDHVSNYDFRNAEISDLPLDPRCARTDEVATDCIPNATDEFGMLRYFPISSPAGTGPERADCIPCEFRNGRFRGYVLLDGEEVRCKIDANAPGLRLITVDFSDINGDRILDAVLRFIPIGPGSNRAPLILPLTRLDTTSAFRTPGAMSAYPDDSW